MRKGVLFVLLGAAMWATLPIFSRYVYSNGSDPVTAAAWRAYLAAGIFLVWFLADGTLKKLCWKELPFYLLYGVVGVGGTFLFYMLAVERLSTAMAAMLLYTAPAFVILLNRIFYREPITKTKLIALLCTFGGCFLVVRGYDPAALFASGGGILIGLLSGVSYSMVTVLGRAAGRKHDSRTNAGLMILFGSLIFLFLRPPWELTAPSAPLWLGYAGLALIGSVGAYLAYLRGLSCGLEGGVASITATAEPVIATLLGVLCFGDLLEIWQVLGIAVVFTGVALPMLYGSITRNSANSAQG